MLIENVRSKMDLMLPLFLGILQEGIIFAQEVRHFILNFTETTRPYRDYNAKGVCVQAGQRLRTATLGHGDEDFLRHL